MNTAAWRCIAVRTMTKSPVALAKRTMHIAKAALSKYSSVYSRHDFTQLTGVKYSFPPTTIILTAG
jgi:hypothetical protein